jgi:hypothetical protein
LYQYREANLFEPHTRCKPSGGPRQFITPGGTEFVDIPETKSIYVFDENGPQTFRVIYMDGRQHPKDLTPSFYGHSIGHWEGDTLVVDTVALNDISFIEGFTPHSDAMTVHERIRFTGPGILEDHIVVTDPVALTKPWEVTRTYRKAAAGNDQLREFACPEGLDPFGKK